MEICAVIKFLKNKMFGVKRYDCTFFNSQFQHQCIDDLEKNYNFGFFKKEYPEQTENILFDNQSNLSTNWILLKEFFLESVFDYSGQKFNTSWAWCVRNQKNVAQVQWNWHTHPYAKYSGVLYLNLPVDHRNNFCYTTEFEIDNGRSMFVEPVIGSWFIFKAEHNHRNGLWNHSIMNGNRYCIAASVA